MKGKNKGEILRRFHHREEIFKEKLNEEILQ